MAVVVRLLKHITSFSSLTVGLLQTHYYYYKPNIIIMVQCVTKISTTLNNKRRKLWECRAVRIAV